MIVLIIILLLLLSCCNSFNNHKISSINKRSNNIHYITSPTDFGGFAYELNQYKPLIESSLTVASVIAVHELGHFYAARFQNMKVASFNIGYGPKLISVKDKYDTEFNLRGVPLGGYVAFPQDVEVDEITGEVIGEINDPDLLQRRPPWQRAIVISGGVIANILLTFILSASTSYFSGIGHPTFSQGIVVTQQPETETPGYKAGLQVKDVILSVNDKILPASDFATQEFVTVAKNNANVEMTMQVKRNDKVITLKGTPNGNGVLGIRVNSVVESVTTEKATNLIEAMKIGLDETERLIYTTASSFARAIQGGLSTNEIGGPIAVVKTGADLAGISNVALVGFAATLSINLALINSLPFPALDGGQLLFVIIEIVTGKPLNRNIKDTITAFAFSTLLWLSVTSFVGDFSRINSSVTPITSIVKKNID